MLKSRSYTIYYTILFYIIKHVKYDSIYKSITVMFPDSILKNLVEKISWQNAVMLADMFKPCAADTCYYNLPVSECVKVTMLQGMSLFSCLFVSMLKG